MASSRPKTLRIIPAVAIPALPFRLATMPRMRPTMAITAEIYHAQQKVIDRMPRTKEATAMPFPGLAGVWEYTGGVTYTGG